LNVAGIDYSMSSPAVAVASTEKEFSFANCLFFAMPANKKLDPVYDNVTIVQNPGTDVHQMKRFNDLSVASCEFLLKHNVTVAALESYAYGSSAGQVFNTRRERRNLEASTMDFGYPCLRCCTGAVEEVCHRKRKR